MNERRVSRILAVLGLVAFVLTPLAAQTPSRFLALETSLQGKDNGNLRWPVGVAVASATEFGVVDTFGERLLVYVMSSGGWIVEKTITLPSSPRGITHDGGRYVVSLTDGRLVSVEGDALDVERFALPSEIITGSVVAKPDGGFWVHDLAGGRVLKLDEDGELRDEIPVTGNPHALAAAPDGGFYIALPADAEVRHHGPNGELLSNWKVPGQGPVPAWPSGLVAASGGDVLVVDRHGGRIVALDASGRLVGVGSGPGWNPGQLLFPAAIALFPDGRVLVADQGNSRVQIFRTVDKGSTP
jgi:DNA-binding beta-propeller fold protein YncE